MQQTATEYTPQMRLLRNSESGELERLRVERTRLCARAEAANQQAIAQQEFVARLLQENKLLIAEMEHLLDILNQKDEVVSQLRGAPAQLMVELVRVRHLHEEVTTKLQRVELERDTAQADLARRSIAHEQAEEMLRRCSVKMSTLSG